MSKSGANDLLDRHTLTLSAEQLHARSFLLGNRAGFALYLPVSANERDATLQGSKWYGASGFGQSFLESVVTWVEIDGQTVVLDRANQTGFEMRLDEAIRVFRVAGREVRERYFVPDGSQAVVVSLEGDFTFGARPELDMRFYQALNSDFSSYRAEVTDGTVLIHNRVTGVGPLKEDMHFVGVIGTVQSSSVELLPPDQRLIDKTYLKDEMREKAIESVYSETRERVPDEAPIWDQYSTHVYSPASIRGHGLLTLVCSFGEAEDDVRACFEDVRTHLESKRAAKGATIARELVEGMAETGNKDVDNAYAHVLTRFNDCLVVRDAAFDFSGSNGSHYYAILAGNKYFMDAWKRDENISLRGLLVTNDYETVRAILDSTWQFQDERTGRLPQIIRTGEALVYHSSDGTLWALRRLFEYTVQSGDASLLEQKRQMVEHFFRASMGFVQRGLLPSGGVVDKEYLWETWEDTPFTPRDGYPVEIELLWLTLLADYAGLVDDETLTKQMSAALEEGRRTFEQFYGDGYLYDSLSYDWTPRRILTPNGHVAFDLKYPLPADLERAMVPLARDQLAGRCGVRSLAPRDWPAVFPKAFLDDPRSHTGKNMASFGIFNYHRGIEWQWLNSSSVAGELRSGEARQAYEYYTKGPVDAALHEAGIGGLSELYDEHGPLGADFQAWSMASFIDSLHLYAGITVDAGSKSIRLAPWIPPEWPYLKLRRRIGDLRFDLRYEQDGPREQRLQLHPVPADCGEYTVTIGIRVGSGRRIQAATQNGTAISEDEWTNDVGDPAESDNRAWLTVPLHGDIDLHVTIE